ncbi:MAG: hypothetical protein LBH29_05145, partial [Elusimicrobiota bacterium]|nr:hypothetical protein [Elusimicrobiota bacterium]
IVIAYIDEELFPQAFAFSIKLSQSGLNGNKKISVFPPAAGKNLSSQLKFADKIGADKTFIFAKTEFENQTLILKNMKDKTQSEVKISSLL